MPWSAATAATAKCKRQFIGFARRRISTTVSPWTCSAIPKRRTELKLLKPSTTSERAKKVPLMMLKTQFVWSISIHSSCKKCYLKKYGLRRCNLRIRHPLRRLQSLVIRNRRGKKRRWTRSLTHCFTAPLYGFSREFVGRSGWLTRGASRSELWKDGSVNLSSH